MLQQGCVYRSTLNRIHNPNMRVTFRTGDNVAYVKAMQLQNGAWDNLNVTLWCCYLKCLNVASKNVDRPERSCDKPLISTIGNIT
jgi:hypothetical protein